MLSQYIDIFNGVNTIYNGGGDCMWRKVQKELEKQNMTIYRLTKLTGVSSSVMYEFKRGKIKKPSFELMEKIADALNVSMDVFRKDEE